MITHHLQTAMTNKSLFIFLFVCALIPTQRINAQTTDFRIRLGANVEKEFITNLSGSLEYEHRFDHNLTTFDKAFVEGSLSYDLKKYLRIGTSWRFLYDMNEKRDFSTGHRTSAYIRYKLSIDDFDFKIKTYIQYGLDELTSSVSSIKNKLINRNSFEIDYNWFGSKFTPFVEYEFFCHINNKNGGIINQSRIKIGTSYRASKSSDISIYYMFENEFNVSNPTDSHILGLGYSLKF